MGCDSIQMLDEHESQAENSEQPQIKYDVASTQTSW